MDTLPKDVTMEIALNLKPADLVRFCSSNKKFKTNICDSKDFWRRKLVKDYPEEMKEIGDIILQDPKKVYMERFQYLSKIIENFIDVGVKIAYGKVAKYIKDEYKRDLFDQIYSFFENELSFITSDFFDGEYDEDHPIYKLNKRFESYTNDFFPTPELTERWCEHDLIGHLYSDYYKRKIKDIV